MSDVIRTSFAQAPSPVTGIPPHSTAKTRDSYPIRDKLRIRAHSMLLAREFVAYISRQLVKSLTPGTIETSNPDLVERSASGPVKTFAVGYQEQQFSELSYAANVARAIGTEHHETVVSMDDFFTALPRLIWHEDEPIAWPSSVSLYFVSKLAAGQVKVVLTGEGSDEMFAGYERYHWNLLNQRGAAAYRFVPAALRRVIRLQAVNSPLLSASLRRKLGHTFIGRDGSVESLFLDNFYCAFSAVEQAHLLSSPALGLYEMQPA